TVDFFFSSRRRHTRFSRDWSSDVCSSDLRWRNLSSIRGHFPPSISGNALFRRSLRSTVTLIRRVPQENKSRRAVVAVFQDLKARSEERRAGKGWSAGGSFYLCERRTERES